MNFVAHNPSTACLGFSALAAGTTTTLSTAALTYAIRGKAYQATAKTNAAAPTTDANTGKAFTPVTAGYGTVIIVGVNPAGNLVAYQGSTEKVDAVGNFVSSPQYSSVPNDFCPIGWLAVKALPAFAGSWTFAAGNNSGVANLVYGFQSLFTLPDRPLVP